MANKLAHLVVEGNTYDIQDEELTNKFDGMTIELSLSNDYVITATLKDGNNTTLGTSTIDLPIENSIVSLGYDTTTNEIIGIYQDDTVSVPHRIRVALSNLQEKLTAGQNISITNNTVSLLGLGEASTETVTGIATLDSGGKVPTSQLPSYVDDVLEYDSLQELPATGETGKIYVTLDTNKTYRWTGSVYSEISQGVVLGETEYTAYRGDRGKIAYDHAAAKGSAYQSGLYKITTNSEGHVTSATIVQKSDITALGIPAQDTTYDSGVATEIDNNNNVNVKYDSDTLEVDSQNRLKVKSPSQTFNFNEAIENVNGTINVRYKGGNWNIGRDSQTNQLIINGKFVKQVEDLDAYTDAPDGEIVEYIGETDESYTNGYFYKFHQGSSTAEYETITIPANKTYITYHFPDGTEETGYEFSDERYEIGGEWMRSLRLNVNSSDNGTYLDGNKWNVFLPISKTGDLITYDEQYVGQIESVIVEIYNYNVGLEDYIQTSNYNAIVECSSLQNAIDIYKTLCDEHNLVYSPYNSTFFNVKGINVINNNNHYQITTGNSASGIAEGHALQLISLTGKILLLESDNYLTNHVATEIREGGTILLLNDGTTESYDGGNNVYYYNNPHYNPPTTATRGTTTEPITLTVPILYNEDGTLKDIETISAYWQRIDVQPNVQQTINDGTTTFTKNNKTIGITSANQSVNQTIKLPNDIVMCKMSDGIVYDSYITYTKIKQYLPDYPYYSDDLDWEIGGNPPMRASITEGNYYLDVDTNHIFVADEVLELLDITSSVVIHGDPNKLYCDVDTNILYRYDGTDFVALTNNFSGDYNDLINKPDLNFLKQVNNLDNYNAQNGEIVEFVGATTSNYVNGYVYKKVNYDKVFSVTDNPFGIPNGIYYNSGRTIRAKYSVSYYSLNGEEKYVGQRILASTQSAPGKIEVGDYVVEINSPNIFQVTAVDDYNITLSNGDVVSSHSANVETADYPIYINDNNDEIVDTGQASCYVTKTELRGEYLVFLPINIYTGYVSKIHNYSFWQQTDVQPRFSGNYNDLDNKPLSVENSKVKYTLSDGTTKLTLAQESELKTVAFSGSYNDLTDKLLNATTSAAGLMSADDKTQVANLTISQISIGAILLCGRITGSGNYLEIFVPCALPSNASNVTLTLTSLELYFDGDITRLVYDSITINSIIPLVGATFDLHLTSTNVPAKTFFVLLTGTLTFNR